jgi:predicted amino acid dehydrogenase
MAHKGLPSSYAAHEYFLPFVEKLERLGLLEITTDIEDSMAQSDIIVTATSSPGSIVTPDKLKAGALICDLSRPPNVSKAVVDERPDVLVIDGGIIAVPGLADLGVSFGFEKGLAFSCMSETMILGLEHHYEHTSLGTDLSIDTILWLRELGKQLGFNLAQFHSFGRTLSEADLKRIKDNRRKAMSKQSPIL